MTRVYLIAGILAACVAFVVYQRHDARQDLRRELEAKRVDHVNEARKIENESRTDTDADLANCLLNVIC